MSFALFRNDEKLLAGFCKPQPGELLSGWLARLAHAHGLTTMDFCHLALPEYKGKFKIDYRFGDENLLALSKLTNSTLKEIKATTLDSYHGRLYNKIDEYHYQRWILPSRYKPSTEQTFSSGLLYCPVCLKNKHYFKKEWLLAISFCCPDCNCMLIDKCPHCNKGSSFMEKNSGPIENYDTDAAFMDTCHRCGKEVTDCPAINASSCFIHAQQTLYDRLQATTFDDGKPTVSYYDLLYNMATLLMDYQKVSPPLKRMITMAFARVGLTIPRVSPAPTLHLQHLPTEKRASLLVVAYTLLENTAELFFDLCYKYDLKTSDILPWFRNAPSWFRKLVSDVLPSGQAFRHHRLAQNRANESYYIEGARKIRFARVFDPEDDNWYDYRVA